MTKIELLYNAESEYSDIEDFLEAETDNFSISDGEVICDDYYFAKIVESILNTYYSFVECTLLEDDNEEDDLVKYTVKFNNEVTEDLKYVNDPGKGVEFFNSISDGASGGPICESDLVDEDEDILVDDRICPNCGSILFSNGYEGNYELLSCEDCGEWFMMDSNGNLLKPDEVYDENGKLIAHPEYYGDDIKESLTEGHWVGSYYTDYPDWVEDEADSAQSPEEIAEDNFNDILDAIDYNVIAKSWKDEPADYSREEILELNLYDILEAEDDAIADVITELDILNDYVSAYEVEVEFSHMLRRAVNKDNNFGEKYLSKFRAAFKGLSEAIEKHTELNDKLWDGKELKPEVKSKLLEIVDKFKKNLTDDGIELDIKDVRLIGSNASYNYTSQSDIDCHIMADLSVYEDKEDLAEKVYQAYKSLWNNKYDPTIYGHEVELYVEPYEGVETKNEED